MAQTIQDLRISLVQCELNWHDPAANRAAFENRIAHLQGQTDLIVLPEMFTTGFTMSPEQAAEDWRPDSPTIPWMQHQAKHLNAAICGSIAVRENGHYFNRMVLITADAEIHRYDKRHLFRMAGEHEQYSAGEQRVIVHYRGWRILLQVCYDLRFPVFSRNRDDYDLALYVANWPKPRRLAWRTLLQARAIENLSYIVGVNRIGADIHGNRFSGDSIAVNFKGEPQIDLAEDAAFTETTSFSLAALYAFREKFPAWQDADQFALND